MISSAYKLLAWKFDISDTLSGTAVLLITQICNLKRFRAWKVNQHLFIDMAS